MEMLKTYTGAVKVVVLAMSFAMTGCVATQAKVTGEVEKPAELVKAIEEITTEPESKEELPGFDAFELSSLADNAYNREDWALAEKYYRRLISQVPQDAYGYFRLGNVLMQYAKVDGAINAYNQAIKREPTHIRALKNRSLAYLLSAEINLESTVKILKEQNDSASDGYLIALGNLQRLNAMPLNETVSPVEGLYLDRPDSQVQLQEITREL